MRLLPSLLGAIAAFSAALPLVAEVKLASPFTSHMVLQRERPVPIWGTADAGETVMVRFAHQEKRATAGPDGNWRVNLDPMPASAEPRVLECVSADSGNRKSAIENQKCSDVLVGEVWLCSGQSNMDFTVAKTEKYYFAGVDNEAAEVAAADHPLIRMFTGEWVRAYEPQRTVAGAWKVCTPENVREFSAIGYFFARDLQRELKVPVGIVTLTYGASCAQAWIRREVIAADPQLKPVLDEFDAKVKAYVPLNETELKEWQAAVDQAKAAGQRPPRHPRPDPVQDQHNPTVMFNGMTAPVVPFAVRGFLWYQGESITGPRELFPRWNETLIRDWRILWGGEPVVSPVEPPVVSPVEPMPFYFCQLAAHDGKGNIPEVRAMQAEALKIPNTAMAVTIDIGDKANVHPRNKQDVGARLARIALAKTYGRSIEWSGPEVESVAQEGGALRLQFAHATAGLVAKGGPLKTFELAGVDGVFVATEAVIAGDRVVVRSEKVATPVAVRYAWANFPEGCNLYNAAGLPAAPFRREVATAAPDQFAALPEAVTPFVERSEISGAVMLLATKDRVLTVSAVGRSDLASGREMKADDLFWIASMTKPVTAVGLAILADDGRLSFDDPVEKFLPEFRGQTVLEEKSAGRRVLVPSPRPITLRDLLTHTSGMAEYAATDPHWTLAEMTRGIAREPLRFAPGNRWAYSTAGFDTLGRVIEVVSGEPFVAFLQHRVFEPLEMMDTTFWLTAEQEQRFARNYRPNPATGQLEETEIFYLYGGARTDRARPPLGGAGLFSTAENVAHFYQMMLGGGVWRGRRILRADTVAGLTRKQTGDLAARPGMPWGLGFCVIEDPTKMEANATLAPGTFGHGGAHGTQSWADPTRGVIYVFMIQRAALQPNPDDSAMRRAWQKAAAAALGRR